MMATTAFFLLIAALAVQIIYIIKTAEGPDPISHYLLSAAFFLLLATTVMRSFQYNFAAVTTLYESLLVLSESLILILVLYRFKSGKKSLPYLMGSGTLLAIILLASASSPIIPKEVVPPVPALQSNWLVLHIIFSFFGEAFFSLAFFSSIYYLFLKDDKKKKHVERISYRAVLIGYFLFTTGGLIFGAIWAYYAWGRYWGWDPKETSAFITWLVYTLYLHLRLTRKIRGKTGSIILIIGFLLTLFTFLGVNFLMSGLHSYS
jgi:ABC-type transport system involved in cytochrome c biogenesis permease subunit